ncbi:sigma-70 family RNA polymerase sigma factor [Pantoea sp. Tr-811]|uniref:sigma-70 family RNA polymerase sigma factor n=1 Tax=Pantoea sp. Tr-811 TaxID=2608361 RepID=UPI0014221BB0|nr:sigma-70 family RNA polymerase sigma factor [Pantoea sp. Tr-811]NIF26558.1 sigma-70 family RNA polymerase sigma factor [Pantoea sp. Tr-811]
MPASEAVRHHDVEGLYSDHHGWLHGWLRKRMGSACDAADLTQDTFLSIITSDICRDIREPRPFLVTIARRLMARSFRRKLLETSYLEALASLPEASTPSPEVQLLALEALQQLDVALDGLPVIVRESFLLAHLQGMSYAQIANQLNVSQSSVKQYLSKANRHCLFAIAL